MTGKFRTAANLATKLATVLAILLSTQLFAANGLAQTSIYRSVDANGNVTFTDTPPSDGKSSEQMEVQRTNITPATIAAPAPASATPGPTGADLSQVTITQPGDETTIGPEQQEFNVAATATPQLLPTQRLQLYVDGAPHGQPIFGASWSVIAPNRGPHDLTVHIIDSEGKSIAESKPVRVYVLRTAAVARDQRTQSVPGEPGEAGTWEPPADNDWSKYGSPGENGTWQGRPRYR